MGTIAQNSCLRKKFSSKSKKENEDIIVNTFELCEFFITYLNRLLWSLKVMFFKYFNGGIILQK